ncbi:hypothetical protein ACTMUQ_41550 [Streptomyces sp. SD11]|uniref:hypothetical protein n=1 Tax=Streptomyces sp. SD11 TaxID=3452209 RepID=UPI003F8A1C5A
MPVVLVIIVALACAGMSPSWAAVAAALMGLAQVEANRFISDWRSPGRSSPTAAHLGPEYGV